MAPSANLTGGVGKDHSACDESIDFGCRRSGEPPRHHCYTAAAMNAFAPDVDALLRLSLIPGLGPVRISRLIDHFGAADAVLDASEDLLQRVRGVGPQLARTIIAERAASAERVARELDRARELGVELIPIGDGRYPSLLHAIPNPPPILYVRGAIDVEQDRYPIAMVGSRACTSYGIEQTERFAGLLASSGLTIVSGGARGIDTAAHRAALRMNGRTIAVLGCGLARCYPPENAELFDDIANGKGAVISELPLETNPNSENFPMRNRIISGLSLGVLVVEAAAGSGALITARVATEEHGREVMAIPGRIDSAASEGSNDLLKRAGAALVTTPADVIAQLEAPARHLYDGVHADRYADPAAPDGLFSDDAPPSIADANLNEVQRVIIETLADAMSLDDLVRRTGLDAAAVRTEVTMLEVRRLIERRGQTLSRRVSSS